MSSVATTHPTQDSLTCDEVDEFGNRYWHDENAKLHRENGPAIIRYSGTQIWFRHGERHRDNGPAVLRFDGTQIWFRHDKLHRIDGPAVIYPTGEVEYWIDDECLTEEQFNVRKSWARYA